MQILRWILVSSTALVAAGFLGLLAVADGFRRSFGASENGPWTVVVPLTVMLLFLAALLVPGQRMLLHVAAVVAVVLAAASVWTLRESVFIGLMGLLYSAAWWVWYWSTAWRQPGAPSS